MGKRWTEAEKSILRKHFESARSIEEVADMIGRPWQSVRKFANAMGLRRPDPTEACFARLEKAMSPDVPMSSTEIAAAAKMSRSNVREALGRMNLEGRCHIGAYRENNGRAWRMALWVLGDGENVEYIPGLALPRIRRERDVDPPRRPTKVIVRRDPLCEALFGPYVPSLKEAA